MSYVARTLLFGLLGLAALGGTGFYKATFIEPSAVAGEEHEEWTDFFVFGLVGTEQADVRRFCQGPVASVRTGGNVGTVLVTVLTIGIYAPRKIYVTCAAGAAQPPLQAVSVDEEHGRPVRVRAMTARGELVGIPEEVEPGVWRVRAWSGGAL